MIETVFLDLDGTLVHTAPGILAGFQKTLHDAGIQAIETIDERIIGPPLLVTLERLTGVQDPRELDRLSRAFQATYDAEGILHADMYPGADAVLSQLTIERRRAFVITNKRQRPARSIVDRLGLSRHLSGLYSMDTVAPPAPSKRVLLAYVLETRGIDADQAVLVGDTAEDAEAAAVNGVRFVAVTYGYGTPLRYLDTAPAAVIDRLGDLSAVVGRLDRS